jgi:hypothetical protein
MGDRVRIVGGSSTPTPDPGEDPLGLMAAWLTRVEAAAVQNLITSPIGIIPTAPLYYHKDYDGLWCWWSASKLLADINSDASQALFDYGVATLNAIALEYPTFNAGPTELPYAPPGYENYNLGCIMYGRDPATPPPPDGVDYLRMGTNYARTGFCYPYYPVYYKKWGADTWPSPVDGGWGFDPTRPQILCREMGRTIASHMAATEYYHLYEAQTYAEYTLLEGHYLWIPRMIGHLYFGLGVDLSAGVGGTEAYIDHWRSLTDDVAAVDGDWTQVPDTWYGTSTSHNYNPFMITHFMMPLILYYENSYYSGEPHTQYKALVKQAVKDMCDAFLAWFQTTSSGGYRGLFYAVLDGGVVSDAVPSDLAYWFMPMFAWLYKETGNLTYYNFAADLATAGNAEAYIVWGKHFNQYVYQAYWGFQWLGWTAQEYKTPWTVDLAGAETWP